MKEQILQLINFRLIAIKDKETNGYEELADMYNLINTLVPLKLDLYFIRAGTGCTCCNDEDHLRGPYHTQEDAERRIKYYKSEGSEYWPLASQYAKRGTYEIQHYKAEELSNNRFLVGDTVYPSDYISYVTVATNGTVENNEIEYFSSETYL